MESDLPHRHKLITVWRGTSNFSGYPDLLPIGKGVIVVVCTIGCFIESVTDLKLARSENDIIVCEHR